jgi:hypothetical protein
MKPSFINEGGDLISFRKPFTVSRVALEAILEKSVLHPSDEKTTERQKNYEP